MLKLGLQLQDVNNTLGSFLGGTYVNDFNRFGRVYKVYVQAEGTYRTKPDDISFFYVRTPGGQMVPLSTLVQMRQASGPEFTNRFNLFRAAEVTGTPAPGYSSSPGAQGTRSKWPKRCCPPDMGYSWNALSYQEKLAEGQGGRHFLLALVLVFLILAAQYESWSPPFSVLLGTPFAAFGAFLGLFIARQISPVFENNVFAQIGLVTLIGLAAKNAILIVEFARAELHKGRPLVDSALDAAKLRFRPILMTAFAFILGVVPLMTCGGRRCGLAQSDGHDSLQRHARRHDSRRDPGPFALRYRGAADRRGEEGAGTRRSGSGGPAGNRRRWRTRRGTSDQAPHRNRSLFWPPCPARWVPGYERPRSRSAETYRFTDTTVYSPDSLAKLDSAAAIDRGRPLVGGLRRRHAAGPDP